MNELYNKRTNSLVNNQYYKQNQDTYYKRKDKDSQIAEEIKKQNVGGASAQNRVGFAFGNGNNTKMQTSS